jgi:hypothetical protein
MVRISGFVLFAHADNHNADLTIHLALDKITKRLSCDGCIQHELAVAGVPESALRRLAAAARPGINIGDAIEALADADRDLETWSKIPAVAAARAELRSTLAQLGGQRNGTRDKGTPAALTPLPTLILPGP